MTHLAAGPVGVTVHGLSWTPLGRRSPVLDDLELQVAPGERVLITGPSGGGKSTLLKALAGVLVDTEDGELSGDVLVGGEAPHGGDSGLLLQDPRSSIVASSIGRDVAFGLENRAVPPPLMWERVDEVLAAVGLEYPRSHSTLALSGGESQRLGLAGVLAPPTGLLLLDEPTSMLDADSADDVRKAAGQVVADRETTLIVVEHRLDGWIDLVDRIIVIAEGRVLADGPVDAVLRDQRDSLLAAGVWIPGAPAPDLVTIPPELCAAWVTHPQDEILIEARRLSVSFEQRRGLRIVRTPLQATSAVTDVSLRLRAGRIHALRGVSGAGKSTLLASLAGLQRPTRGDVSATAALARGPVVEPWKWSSPELAARVGWVPQRALDTVAATTCRSSALATARVLGRDAERRCTALFDHLGIGHLAQRNPHHLSGGEARRLALATSIVHGPELLALDEPTVGQDRATWAAVTAIARAAAQSGVAVVTATHDEEFARLAAATTLLHAGRVAA